jgi:hypothetical protein
MTFQKITMIVASLILLLFLIVIGVLIYQHHKDAVWPPMISECPDYWKVVGPEVCENVKDLGSCKGVKDFSGPEWQGQSGLKKKYEWARNCGVVWDGITNNTSLN